MYPSNDKRALEAEDSTAESFAEPHHQGDAIQV